MTAELFKNADSAVIDRRYRLHPFSRCASGSCRTHLQGRLIRPVFLTCGCLKRFLTPLLLLVALAAAAYFFAASTRGLHKQPMRSAIRGFDNSLYYFWLRSGFLERPFDFRQSAEITRTMLDTERERYLHSPPTPTGRLKNKYGVGWAVAGIPFFIAADNIVAAANAGGLGPIPHDGYGPIYQYALLLGQLGYAAASLILAWQIVRRWVPGPEALQGVLLCWLGSFLFVYQTWQLSMAHNLTFFAITWAWWAALRIHEKRAGPGIWIQLGLASGLAVITRYQAALYLLFPLWVALCEIRQGGRAARIGLGLALVAGSLAIFPQLLAWKIVYGSWIVDSYPNERFYWFAPHVLEVLFSPFHGLFYWSPVLFIGLIGFLAWARSGGAIAWVWTGCLGAVVWTNAAWGEWWFGASYGARAFEGCVLFFMLGTAWLLQRTASRPWLKTALVILLLAFAAANLTLSRQVLKNRIPAEQPVTYAEMVGSFR
jgi:hypothetical protein